MRKDCRVRQASGNLIRGAGQDSCSGVLSLLVESPVCTCGHGRWCSGRRNEGDGSERTQGERPPASERSGGKGLVDQGAARAKVRFETFHGSGADRLERKKDYPRAVGEKKTHSPHRGQKALIFHRTSAPAVLRSQALRPHRRRTTATAADPHPRTLPRALESPRRPVRAGGRRSSPSGTHSSSMARSRSYRSRKARARSCSPHSGSLSASSPAPHQQSPD